MQTMTLFRRKARLYPAKTLVTVVTLVFSALNLSCAFSGVSIAARREFSSCASPRFDIFSEKLIGDWKWQEHREKENVESIADLQESVCEVMRSCGGAVQGIRELPSFSSMATRNPNEGDNSNGEEGYYLNRANDGFLYFDNDGSYSCGPVSKKDEGSLWISSLTLGESRLILAKNLGIANEDSCSRLQVFRKSTSIIPDEPAVEENLQKLPENITWEEIIRCRMPSSSQPWTAQRLKWETFPAERKQDIVLEDSNPRMLKSWILKMSTSDEPAMDDIFEELSESYVLSVGVVCSVTGVVKSITRQYSSDDGSLKSVAWLQGTARQS